MNLDENRLTFLYVCACVTLLAIGLLEWPALIGEVSVTLSAGLFVLLPVFYWLENRVESTTLRRAND